jgi:very-short-patch-repair endonuclease
MSTHHSAYDLSTEAAYLRQHPSDAEQLLLEQLTAKLPAAFEFQGIAAGLIVTFYFETARLAVLLEDESHDHSYGYYRQLEHIKKLENAGLSVLILPTFEVLESVQQSMERIAAKYNHK